MSYSEQDIDDLFTSHSLDEATVKLFLEIKERYKLFAKDIHALVPNSRHKTRATTLLLQSKDAAVMSLITEAVKFKRVAAAHRAGVPEKVAEQAEVVPDTQ